MISSLLLSLCIVSSLFLCVAIATINFKEGRHSVPLLVFALLLGIVTLIHPSTIFPSIIISCYPGVFAYYVHTIAKQLSKKDIVISGISIVALLASVILPLHIQPAIIAIFQIYYSFTMKNSVPSRFGLKLFRATLFIESGILGILTLFANTHITTLTIMGFITFFLTITIYDILKRSQLALYKMRSLAHINANLTKLTQLLKQRNDQYVTMLNKKDNDIQMLSKYSTMAEITASIAHEIAQPLTGIKSIAQNMMDDINLDDFNYLEALSELQKICTMVDKATFIMDHIRSFNTNNHIYKLIDINSIIMNAVTLMQNQLKKHNIDIILLLNESIPRIYGNAISIEQILINLITNAKDAIIEKTNKTNPDYSGRIMIKTDHHDDHVFIIIEDNGIGIQPDIQKHIWSPFFTTKRYSQSLGIGLSISKKIITDHNGQIFINSKPEEGSVFTIKFSLIK